MDIHPADPRPARDSWRPEGCRRVALVLQGGGALGAYQAGVYEALHEAGVALDWIAGVSIGAINGALIAGNPPERRVAALRAFWERITDNRVWAPLPDGDLFRQWRHEASAALTMLQGQPGFFTPNVPNPWLSAPGARTATAFYDSSPLQATLEELIDFDRLNDGRIRFSVGAVKVSSGNFAYFDTATLRLTAAHIMASGALPPALPMVRVGTDDYWDGGLVSNTPLGQLLDNLEGRNTLAFQVDLFSARGPVPRSMPGVMAREKDIRYSSRTRAVTDYHRRIRDLEMELKQALELIPADRLDERQKALKHRLERLPEVVVLHLIYRHQVYEGQAKDYEFSARTMREHWQAGLADTRATLQHGQWLAMPPPGSGIQVHDIHKV
ncbi:patatin-like phospholipase family protein [Pseudoroseomonas cervicalis]|uniref:patatin-like phospholipase family protein n=1 Tax=Teichococcus cervicalis TaxID=204525 RepID=UPI0022F1841E|nr:patatin-like phospholipase family protein [Pseudoroseomonas cervicalis]WBV44054.1 patatin-like phospholipase family protein [Pseudoroseomonas cervicalis]